MRSKIYFRAMFLGKVFKLKQRQRLIVYVLKNTEEVISELKKI
jgi:hypothetical protein